MARTTINDYYVKAFQKLEDKGKDTWNWSAMFFTSAWLLYRKMYLYFFMYVLFSILVLLIAMNIGKDLSIVRRICDWVGYILMPFFGYWGNRLYYRVTKKRIRNGYHLLDKYHPFSVSILLIFTVITAFYSGIIAVLEMNKDKYFIISFLISVLFAILAGVYALADWSANRFHKRKRKNVLNTEISEKNIRQYLMYNNSNHFLGYVAVTLGLFIGMVIYYSMMLWFICDKPKEQISAAIEKWKAVSVTESSSVPEQQVTENTSEKK